jgi:hypothetical protein
MKNTLKKKLEKIAKEHLDLDTLEAQNSDRLDFKEQSVWGIKKALEAAYEAGQQNMRKNILPKNWVEFKKQKA